MLLGLASATATAADQISAQEKERIEYLINHLESMKDATFIRNDKEYDARTAAFFLGILFCPHRPGRMVYEHGGRDRSFDS